MLCASGAFFGKKTNFLRDFGLNLLYLFGIHPKNRRVFLDRIPKSLYYEIINSLQGGSEYEI